MHKSPQKIVREWAADAHLQITGMLFLQSEPMHGSQAQVRFSDIKDTGWVGATGVGNIIQLWNNAFRLVSYFHSELIHFIKDFWKKIAMHRDDSY